MTTTQTTELATKPAAGIGERIGQSQVNGRLLELIASGDKTAFAELYDNTSSLLFGLLLRIIGEQQRAEAVLEQVYRDVWQQSGLFDRGQDKPLTWLITLAHRRGIEHLKKDAAKEVAAVGGGQTTTAAANLSAASTDAAATVAAYRSERARLVESAVNALSPAQREMLELAYFSGMTEAQIARYLGFEFETVRLGLTLAMKKLSNLFDCLKPNIGQPGESVNSNKRRE